MVSVNLFVVEGPEIKLNTDAAAARSALCETLREATLRDKCLVIRRRIAR